jgi:hypothetical protein
LTLEPHAWAARVRDAFDVDDARAATHGAVFDVHLLLAPSFIDEHDSEFSAEGTWQLDRGVQTSADHSTMLRKKPRGGKTLYPGSVRFAVDGGIVW